VKELDKGASGEASEKMHRFEAAKRTRDEMRLVENIDGFSVARTTNFFISSTLVTEEEKDFGLTDLELYDLLKRQSTANKAGQAFDLTRSFHGEIIRDTKWSEEEQEDQKKLLQDVMKVIALPVVVKDTDSSFVGLYQEELDKEFAHQKVDLVDETRVKLVLADLFDLGKKEVKRIR
jgi:hypothetical protein